MRITVKQLRHVIHEAMRNNAQFAPTDDDTRTPGHLPSELPKSACLEDDVNENDAPTHGRRKCEVCGTDVYTKLDVPHVLCFTCGLKQDLDKDVDEGNDIHCGGFDNKDAVYKLARRAQASR